MVKGWKNWFDSDAPEEAHIPDGHDSLDTFKRLLLIRSWCPDRTVPMAKKYIEETMGIKFAEGVITNLEEMQDEGDKSIPMVCFLSMGSDPTDNIERLAKKKNLSTTTNTLPFIIITNVLLRMWIYFNGSRTDRKSVV